MFDYTSTYLYRPMKNDFFDIVNFSRKKKDGIYNKDGLLVVDLQQVDDWELFDDLPCVQVEKNGRLYLYNTDGQPLSGTENGCQKIDIYDTIYTADGVDYAHPYRCTQFFTVQLEEYDGRLQYVVQSNKTGKTFAVGHDYEDFYDYIAVCHYDEQKQQSRWTLYNKNGRPERSAQNVHALHLNDDGVSVQVQKELSSPRTTRLTRAGKIRQAILFAVSFAFVATASAGGIYIYNDYQKQTTPNQPFKIDNTSHPKSRPLDYQNTRTK